MSAYLPVKRKFGHILTRTSRKSVNRFLLLALRVIAASPVIHFHQTLTFPWKMNDATAAKQIFFRFIKEICAAYAKDGIAGLYVQESRKDEAIHFHVSFLFFRAENLKFSPSRLYIDFRHDIFERWNRLNDLKAVHKANEMKEHKFDMETMRYFTKAIMVDDGLAKREQTNWWGGFNKRIIFRCSQIPSRQEIKAAYNASFKKAQ